MEFNEAKQEFENRKFELEQHILELESKKMEHWVSNALLLCGYIPHESTRSAPASARMGQHLGWENCKLHTTSTAGSQQPTRGAAVSPRPGSPGERGESTI
jgi:hypothetical protein